MADWQGQWHLDKKVPVALIITIMMQTAGGIWFISKLDSRVAALEQATAYKADNRERIVRLETEIPQIKEMLGRIDRKLDRLTTNGPR